MQLTQQDNVTYVTIADNAAAIPASTGGITDVPVTPTTLAAGGAAIVDEGGFGYSTLAAFAALSDSTKLRTVQNIGGELFSSAAFTKGAITKGKHPVTAADTFATVSQYSAAVQQITRIGYNGTTGALPVANDTSYWIKIRKNDNDAANRSQPASLFSQFKTDATGNQAELAFGLVEVGIKNMSTQAQGTNGYLRFEAICDEAGAAITSGGATPVTSWVFTYGSAVVESSAVGIATLTNLNVGDVIKIAAATTSPVYKVEAIELGTATTTTKVTLTYAYQGADATVAIGTSRRILEAAHIIAEYGVQLRGVADDFNVNSFRNYYSNRFTGTFSDTSVLNTLDTAARNGSGVWQEVAMAEYMSMGNQGENSMLAVPPTMRTASVVTDGEYDGIMITVEEDIHGLTSQNKADSNILIYAEDGSGSPTGNGIALALGVQTLLT